MGEENEKSGDPSLMHCRACGYLVDPIRQALCPECATPSREITPEAARARHRLLASQGGHRWTYFILMIACACLAPLSVWSVAWLSGYPLREAQWFWPIPLVFFVFVAWFIASLGTGITSKSTRPLFTALWHRTAWLLHAPWIGAAAGFPLAVWLRSDAYGIGFLLWMLGVLLAIAIRLALTLRTCYHLDLSRDQAREVRTVYIVCSVVCWLASVFAGFVLGLSLFEATSDPAWDHL